MFKDVKELKKFIIWCKEQKVESVKYEGLEFKISEIGMLQDLKTPDLETITKDLASQSTEAKDQDTEDLFWSAGPQRI